MMSESGVENNASVWQHIVQRSPVPERDEIAQIIGHKLIDRNKVTIVLAIFENNIMPLLTVNNLN